MKGGAALDQFLLKRQMITSFSPISNHFILNIDCKADDPDQQSSVDSHALLRIIEEDYIVDLVRIASNIENGLNSKGMDAIYDK